MTTKAATTMTDTADTAPSTAQLDRIAQLRAKRGQPTPLPNPPGNVAPESPSPTPAAAAVRGRRRQRHVAQGSRIVAAGLGASAMFGIVGVLGFDHPFTPADESVPTPVTPDAVAPTPPPIQVVVHRVPASTIVPTEPDVAVAQASVVEPNAATAEAAAPIVLTANPVVQTITVATPAQASAPAPAATTRGSD